MLANRTSRWSLAAAVLCLALLAASWFLLVSPRRAQAADTRTQSAAVESQAVLLQEKIDDLKVLFADLPKRRAELKAIRKELPADGGMPKFVRDLQSYAVGAGVTLDNLTPGSPALVTTEGTPVDPAAGAPAASAASPQLVGIPITLTVTGDYFEAALFIKYVQTKLDRALLISSVAVAPGTVASSVPETTATAIPTVTPVAIATPVIDSDLVGVTIIGSIFVLLDGTSTLADVTKAAKDAAVGKTAVTATPTPSSTATAK